jgi:hypothetical protein
LPVNLAFPFPGESGFVGLFERRFGLEPPLPLRNGNYSVWSTLELSPFRAPRTQSATDARETFRRDELTRRMKVSSQTKTFFDRAFICGDKEWTSERAFAFGGSIRLI